MNTVKLNTQKQIKRIEWKSFFDIRLFRYSFLKQLKSISSYILCFLIILIGFLMLLLSDILNFKWESGHWGLKTTAIRHTAFYV